METSKMDTHFHVLAVYDSLIDRKLIERLLKTSSFQVTVVDSPFKALQLLGLNGNNNLNNDLGMKINMIITNYSMPGMTGYELLRKIKGSERLKDVPVVIMSSENIPGRINKLKPHLWRSKAKKDCCKLQCRWFKCYSTNARCLLQSCL